MRTQIPETRFFMIFVNLLPSPGIHSFTLNVTVRFAFKRRRVPSWRQTSAAAPHSRNTPHVGSRAAAPRKNQRQSQNLDFKPRQKCTRAEPSSPTYTMTVAPLPLLLLLLVQTVRAVPPAPPLQCNDAGTDCVLTNAFGAWGARAAVNATRCGGAGWDVRFPTTETELVAAVADAARRRTPVKAVSGFSHTIPAWACPDGAGGHGPAMIISTRDLTATLEIDAAAGTVTAAAGVGFRRLIDELAARGWALNGAPYWDGASVAGILATASHGSGSGAGAALHDHLLAVTLVCPAAAPPFARSVRLSRGDPDFDAAAVSLGLMGVVSSVTLAMQPMFKRNVTYHLLRDDAGLENVLATFPAAHDFPDITWFPSRRKALLRADDRAPASADGDGVNDYLGFRAFPSAVAEATRAAEDLAESTRSIAGRCLLADTVLAAKVALGNGLRRRPGDAVFAGYPVVGFQHRMQTSGGCSRSPKSDLLNRCAWDPRIHGLFFYESTAVFSPAAAAAFIRDVKLLREAVGAERLCGLDVYNGFLIRFVRASSAYLGYAEDAVVMDFNYYRRHDVDVEGGEPRMEEEVLEEIEQMAFFKHRARPHWAKNRNVAFVGTRAKLPRLGRFLQVRDKYDPQGLFWSDWARRVLLLDDVQVLGHGCALDGMCVCSKDEHCAPERRYFCRPGVVYPDARVCRYEAAGNPSGESAPAPASTA